MADKNLKWEDNIQDRIYVDQTCIACDACIISAPENFAMDDDDGHAYVIKQPDNPEEEDQVREAMEGCPVESIGDDGES